MCSKIDCPLWTEASLCDYVTTGTELFASCFARLHKLLIVSVMEEHIIYDGYIYIYVVENIFTIINILCLVNMKWAT